MDEVVVMERFVGASSAPHAPPVVRKERQWLLECQLRLEYKSVIERAATGVYVAPCLSDSSKWEGQIFIGQGPYTGCVLRFELSFGENYPRVVPRLTLVRHRLVGMEGGDGVFVEHPMVSPRDGSVWLDRELFQGEELESLALSCILYLRRLVADPEWALQEVARDHPSSIQNAAMADRLRRATNPTEWWDCFSKAAKAVPKEPDFQVLPDTLLKPGKLDSSVEGTLSQLIQERYSAEGIIHGPAGEDCSGSASQAPPDSDASFDAWLERVRKVLSGLERVERAGAQGIGEPQ